MKSISIILTFFLLLVSTTSCAVNDVKGKHNKVYKETGVLKKIKLHKDAVLVTITDNKGRTKSFLANGKPLKPCIFCPRGKEKECAKDTSGKYCKGTAGGVVTRNSNANRIITSVNPICITETIDGKSRSECFCWPNEVHELCP